MKLKSVWLWISPDYVNAFGLLLGNTKTVSDKKNLHYIILKSIFGWNVIFYYRLGSLKEIFNDGKLDLASFRSRLRQCYGFDRTLHGKKLQAINFQFIQYTISLLVKCTFKTFDMFQWCVQSTNIQPDCRKNPFPPIVIKVP